MITWILLLLNKIEIAATVLAVLGIAWAIYLLLFLVIRANRSKRTIKNAFIAGAAATFVCDVIWFFKFFDNFEYLNPGAAGFLWLLIIFAVMLILVMVQSYFNVNRYQHEEKIRSKEQEKSRKKESRKKKFEAEEQEKEK